MACEPDSDWGCDARKKLGIARGALYSAREALEENCPENDEALQAIDEALEKTKQPHVCGAV